MHVKRPGGAGAVLKVLPGRKGCGQNQVLVWCKEKSVAKADLLKLAPAALGSKAMLGNGLEHKNDVGKGAARGTEKRQAKIELISGVDAAPKAAWRREDKRPGNAVVLAHDRGVGRKGCFEDAAVCAVLPQNTALATLLAREADLATERIPKGPAKHGSKIGRDRKVLLRPKREAQRKKCKIALPVRVHDVFSWYFCGKTKRCYREKHILPSGWEVDKWGSWK